MPPIQLHFYDIKHLDVDLYHQILSLRQQVFVVEQNCAYLDCDDVDLMATHVVGRVSSDRISCYCRVFSDRNHIHIGRVLVASAFRKMGFAREMMIKTLDFCELLYFRQSEHFSPEILISAQCYLVEFYKSLGFEKSGDSFLEDGIPHQNMRLNILNRMDLSNDRI